MLVKRFLNKLLSEEVAFAAAFAPPLRLCSARALKGAGTRVGFVSGWSSRCDLRCSKLSLPALGRFTSVSLYGNTNNAVAD